MKQFIYSFAFFTFVSTSFIAQSSLSKEEVTKYAEMTIAAEGTYQIQMINTRHNPTVLLSLIQEIENKRDDTKTVFFYMNASNRVKVLSRQEVSSEEFAPIARFRRIALTDVEDK